MTIVGRHIRRDFDRWTDYSSRPQPRSMCGRRTTEKYLGIPSITEQPLEIDGKSGWCPNCLLKSLGRIKEFNEHDYQYMPDNVRKQWLEMLGVVAAAAKVAGILTK